MKKILAVKPSINDITLAIVEGTQGSPKLKKIDKEVYKIPSSGDPSKDLLTTMSYISDLIKKEEVDEVHIVKAVKSQKGSVSSERVKNEATVQLAASSLEVSSRLVAPQTIRAAEKKQKAPEDLFNHPFKSKDKKEVAFLGFMGLQDQS